MNGAVPVELVGWVTRFVGGDGSGRRVFEEPVASGATVRTVLRALTSRFPELARALWHGDELGEHIEVLVNDAVLGIAHSLDSPVVDGDRIALIGQFMGGSQLAGEALQLAFLGSGDAFGSGGRLQTCLYLGDRSGALLVDCGASSLAAMKRAAVDPSSIGLVVLTHLHGDHFGGVPFLILDGQFARRTRPLVIAGPCGVRARVEAAMEVMFPGSSAVARRFAVEYVELGEAPVTIGSVRVSAVAVVHASGAPAHAVRVERDGKAVGYSGDTEWTDALLDVARAADVFVCEAYTFERKVKNHLDWTTVRANRHRFECRRLVLTHLGPEMLARLGDVDAECAEDGLVLRL